MHLSWMYIIQHGFNVVFATKNKRFTHLLNFGNLLEFFAFLVTLLYTFTFYKGYRLNSFLVSLTNWELG